MRELIRRRAISTRYTMFGSDNENNPSSPGPSPAPSHAHISVRGDDDGVRHRKKSSGGTPASVGTTQGSEDSKMSQLAPERSRGFCQKGSSIACLEILLLTINIPYLLRQSYMALIPARRTFALRKIFISMLFLSIDGLVAISEIKSRLCKPVARSFAMSKTLDAKPGVKNLTRIALSLRKELQPVQSINCIGCHVRLGFHASRGVIPVRVM